ncbi:MAG: dienelactone hydrolase family protein [Bacteroidales bacterium]|nr:dienelactone hydrolase family protein [Bacteroidales bacterium]MBN2821236.1 dienelactone hydrolase family protein [Bacteroidales bacterium]
MKAFFIFSFFLLSLVSFSQEKVSFYAEDSLKITADLYLLENRKPFIVLLHQAGSGRGEYNEIAPKLNKLGYNCLAVDLRSGQKSNSKQNETAERAKEGKYPNKYLDAVRDIDASINYVRKFNKLPVVLFGSSYSASLALLQAAKSDEISAVIAFSPGEYFQPELEVREEISSLNKPLFIASTKREYNYVKELVADTNSEISFFKPSEGDGVHGASALWEKSNASEECWLNLSFFFRKLKEI